MSSVDAALAAMDTAEQEARELLEAATELAALLPDMATVARWARDRLRLIQQHRGHLTTHSRWTRSPQPPRGPVCEACGIAWPCPLVESVTHHWTQEDA